VRESDLKLKLVGLDLAREVDDFQNLSERVGSPVFMAPEVAMGGKYQPFPVDIY